MTELNEDKLPEIAGLAKALTKEAKSAGFSILVYVEGPEVYRHAKHRHTRKYVFFLLRQRAALRLSHLIGRPEN